MPYIGITDDVAANIWFLWNAHNALLHDIRQLFYTTLQMYPHGVSLRFDTPIVNSLISLPLFLLFGPIVSYNFVILVTYIGTLIGMFLFLYSVTKQKGPSFIGALAFTFCAYRLQKTSVGHLDILSTTWVGFCLYFCYEVFQRISKPSGKHMVGFIVSYVAQAYTDYRTFFMLSILLLFIYIRFGLQSFYSNKGKTFVQLTLISLGCSILFVAPLLFLYRDIASYGSREVLELHEAVRVHRYLDIADFLRPRTPFTSSFVGYGTLIMSIIPFLMWKSLKKPIRFEIVFWGVVCIFFLLLSFGPAIMVSGYPIISSPLLPYNLFTNTPVLRLFHKPSLFIMCIQIALSVLTAYGVVILVNAIRHDIARRVIIVFLSVAAVVQNLRFIPMQLEYFSVDKTSTVIANGPQGSVLAIPFGYFDTFRQAKNMQHKYQILQQLHFRKPLLGGYLTYVPDETFDRYRSQNVLQRIVACQELLQCIPLTDAEASVLFREYDVRYILIYTGESIYSHMIPFFTESFPRHTITKSSNATVIVLHNE